MVSGVERDLADRGWAVVDLPDPSPIIAARDWLVTQLQSSLPGFREIETYHRFVADDQHLPLMFRIAEEFWKAHLGRNIISSNVSFFRQLLGPDLHVQKYPYLRIVRPAKDDDAVPLHRDTYYGASPYELSVVVPFTEMTDQSGLCALSGSHLQSDTEYPFVQHVSPNVKRGSTGHKLGYAYAPKLLDPAVENKAERIPVKVGQALIFGLSLVHGGGSNISDRTRFSTDVRVVNSLAPVTFSRGVHDDYYMPLCSSVVSQSARTYLEGVEISAAADLKSI